jgi:hypothetical protein
MPAFRSAHGSEIVPTSRHALGIWIETQVKHCRDIHDFTHTQYNVNTYFPPFGALAWFLARAIADF